MDANQLSDIRFTDIHCHLLPGIDDGAKSWRESLEMAKIAVADGFQAVICTPHQLGSFSHNTGSTIRNAVQELQEALQHQGIPLKLAAGADVRIEPCMYDQLRNNQVLTLAGHQKHLLLELPHEIYLPLEGVLDQLGRMGIAGILSHPERNQGVLNDPAVLESLIERGCLMQVTCGSLNGAFGDAARRLAERMLVEGWVHFLATDAHGAQSRRPLMRRAFERVAELTDADTALQLCCQNPQAVFEGRRVQGGFLRNHRTGLFTRLFSRRTRAA